MATLYKFDGTTLEVSPEDGVSFHLPELYRMIDTDMVEVVRLQDTTHILICDEEAKLKDGWEDRRNEAATKHFMIGREYPHGDFISGNALYCKDDELR